MFINLKMNYFSMNRGNSPVNEGKAGMNGINLILRPGGNIISQSTVVNGPSPSPPLPRYLFDQRA